MWSTCSYCGRTYPLWHFWRDSNKPFGITSKCKDHDRHEKIKAKFRNTCHSEETKRKISIATKKTRSTLEYREKIAEIMRNRSKLSDEMIQEYAKHPEAVAWIKEHAKELNADKSILTEARLRTIASIEISYDFTRS